MTDPAAEQSLEDILGIGKSAVPLTPEQEIDRLAATLLGIRTQIEALQTQETAIENAIVARTPDEPGEAVVDGDQMSFMVSRNEVWSWDSDKIMSKIPTVPVPDHIKVKYSVDKKKYLALPQQDQTDLLDALTTKPGAARVKVGPKVTNP